MVTHKKPWYVNVLDDIREIVRRKTFCEKDEEDVEKACSLIRRSRMDEDDRRIICIFLKDICTGILQNTSTFAIRESLQALLKELTNANK